MVNNKSISWYSKYNPEVKRRKKTNPLEEIYPPLPNKRYDVIYADPLWDYGGKMQYDKSSIKSENIDFERNIVSFLFGNFILTNSIAFFYTFGLTSIVTLHDYDCADK